MEDSWRLVRVGEFVNSIADIVLDQRNVIIGRNVEKKYRLDSLNVSRQHASLRFENGRWDITDLRSYNGVFVNGAKIAPSQPFVIRENDLIGFGKPIPVGQDVFVFRLAREDRPSAAEQNSNATVETKPVVLHLHGTVKREHTDHSETKPVIHQLHVHAKGHYSGDPVDSKPVYPTDRSIKRERSEGLPRPLSFQIDDEDDEVVVTNVVPPKRRRESVQEESSDVRTSHLPGVSTVSQNQLLAHPTKLEKSDASPNRAKSIAHREEAVIVPTRPDNMTRSPAPTSLLECKTEPGSIPVKGESEPTIPQPTSIAGHAALDSGDFQVDDEDEVLVTTVEPPKRRRLSMRNENNVVRPSLSPGISAFHQSHLLAPVTAEKSPYFPMKCRGATRTENLPSQECNKRRSPVPSSMTGFKTEPVLPSVNGETEKATPQCNNIAGPAVMNGTGLQLADDEVAVMIAAHPKRTHSIVQCESNHLEPLGLGSGSSVCKGDALVPEDKKSDPVERKTQELGCGEKARIICSSKCDAQVCPAKEEFEGATLPLSNVGNLASVESGGLPPSIAGRNWTAKGDNINHQQIFGTNPTGEPSTESSETSEMGSHAEDKQFNSSGPSSYSFLLKPCSVVLEPLCSFVGRSSRLEHVRPVENEQDDCEAGTMKSEGCCDGNNFSQHDGIIVLSDSEDSLDFLLNHKIKEEPEEIQQPMPNCNTDQGKWNDIGDIAVGTASTSAALTDGDLESRLVWSDDDSDSKSLDESDKNDDESDKNDDPDMQEDFFPILSQNFYEDHCTSTEVRSSSFSKADLAKNVPAHYRKSLGQSNVTSRIPQKKIGLKEKLLKTMKHRVPMAGGGSAVRKTMPELPQKSGAKSSEPIKKPHYKKRFESRTVRLLEEDSIAVPNAVRNKITKRTAPENMLPTARKKLSTPPVSHLKNTTSAAALEPQGTAVAACEENPLNLLCMQESSQCLAVPSFKQGERFSRLNKPLDRPCLKLVSDGSVPLEAPGMLQVTSPLKEAVTKKQTQVRFNVGQATSRTDEEKAEFAERAKASLRRRKLEHAQKSKVNVDTLIFFVLSWKVQWLKEQMSSPTLPPLLDCDKLRNKRAMYSSVDEYRIVHYHFLCLEIWENVFRYWRDHSSTTSWTTFQCALLQQDYPLPGDVIIISCVVLATAEGIGKFWYPVEGHLVRLDLRIKDQQNVALPVFGFIVKHHIVRNCYQKNAVHELFQNAFVKGSVQVYLTIHVKARDVTLDLGKLHRLSIVAKISPHLRQMEAVADLEKSPYVESIVRPNAHHFWCHKGRPPGKSLGNFNKDQEEVICSAVAAMKVKDKRTKILLLHGPPGTGKTHTLVGMTMSLLHECNCGTLLVVAPSNAAVDELGRRLLAERTKQARNNVPPDQLLKVVRVGQNRAVHPEVRGICLEELVQKNIQREVRDRCQEFDNAIALAEKEIKRCQLEIQRANNSEGSDLKSLRRLEFQIKDQQKQILRLTEQRRSYSSSCHPPPKQLRNVKIKVLRKANVVLSTLNSCRSRILEEAFGRSSPNSFSGVIADESTQCTEVESLLCLQYRTNLLVLVGDPKQLPATVLSRDAVDRNFQESLFERFYMCLQNEEGPHPIFMLTEQRRMHSEICAFPSQYFYNGRLQPVVGLDAQYASFSLVPYLVFNVLDSPEENEEPSTSWKNDGEAVTVLNLCRAILGCVGPETSLGIITPYQAQKDIITRLLRSSPPARVALPDVNTIDGFQGQEKDIIVLSCVRAHHQKGFIGFVADARRLNVAITRARKALFICGHLNTLKESPEWAALFADAESRGKVRNISASCTSEFLERCIKKQS